MTSQLLIPFEPEPVASQRLLDAFEKFSLEAARRRSHFSADAVLHRVRWETSIVEGEDFKVNNNLSPYLARWFLARHPELAGFFETRVSKADEHE